MVKFDFDRSTLLVCKIKNLANRIHVHNMHFNLCFHMLMYLWCSSPWQSNEGKIKIDSVH